MTIRRRRTRRGEPGQRSRKTIRAKGPALKARFIAVSWAPYPNTWKGSESCADTLLNSTRLRAGIEGRSACSGSAGVSPRRAKLKSAPLALNTYLRAGCSLRNSDFVAMSFGIVFVSFAVFLVPGGFVRPIAERLVFGQTAHANPNRLWLRFDFERSLV